jgi:hypothetical protein
MSTFLGWIFFSIAAGLFASQRRNRSAIGWFFVAIVFTPIAAFVLLLILHPAAPTIIIPTPPAPTPRPPMKRPKGGNDNMSERQRINIEATVLTVSVVLILTMGWLAVAHAQQQTFRDSAGRTLGTATQSGNQTTFRDASGRTTGTAATDSAGTTIFRDSMGRTTGSTSTPRRR